MRINPKKLKRFKETFDLWVRWSERASGVNPRNIRTRFEFSSDGLSALECLYIHESIGKTAKCREVDVAEKAVIGREQLKLDMENWEQGRADGTLPLVDWLSLCEEEGLPDWVFREVNLRAVKFTQEWYKKFYEVGSPRWNSLQEARDFIFGSGGVVVDREWSATGVYGKPIDEIDSEVDSVIRRQREKKVMKSLAL